MFYLLKMLDISHRAYSQFVFEIFKAVTTTTTTVFRIAAPRRGAGLSILSLSTLFQKISKFFVAICLWRL